MMRWCSCCRDHHPADEFADAAALFCLRWIAEECLGTAVELDYLAPNQAVGWGDGRTTHMLYTCVDPDLRRRALPLAA